MTQSSAVRLVTELALANRGFVSLPAGGVDGNVLVKSGPAVAWGSGAGGTAVNSVNGRTGAVVLSKTDVGLANLDNTADLAKPISTSTAAALAGKADFPVGGADGQFLVKSGASTAWSSSSATGNSAGVTLITTADSVTTILTKLGTPGVVRFAPGTYNVGANVLYVYGTSRTIVYGYGATINSTMDNAIMMVNNAPHVIEGLTLVGQGAATNNQGGINLYSVGCTVTRCSFSNLARYAIYSAADNSTIMFNTTNQTSLGSITDSPSVAAIFNSGHGVRIENNVCTNTVWGITNRGNDATTGINDGVIAFNSITMRAGAPSTSQGISSAHARHQRIAFNTIHDYASNCIDQYGAFYSEIVGNTCVNGSSDGIFVGHVGTKSITVANNNIYNCAGAGIRVWDSASDVKVIGNSIYDVGDGASPIGIYAAGSINAGESDISNVDIQGNYIDGNFQSGYTKSCGIVVRHATVVDISGNSIRHVARQAVYAENTDIATVRNNRAQDAGSNATTGYASFHTSTGCTRFLFDDNVVYGNANAAMALRLESGVGHRVRGLRWRSVPSGISDTATSTVTADNTAF